MATTTGKARTGTAKDEAQDLEAEIAKLRAEMASLAEQISRTRDTSVSAARKAASEGLEQMKVQGEAAMEDLKANARDVEQQLTETVREKPITSLAIAAGVGFLFAVLMRR
ncbi:MAG: YqjD family protein [Aliihoeflea sp.]